MAATDVLSRSEQADLLRFTTVGSVDDGKSTLIGRLLADSKCIYEDHLATLHATSRRLSREQVDLALLTDGLKAEREQGITIDVAYRYFSTPRRRFIIGDVPGHEQYTRNMVTGASTANLAVLLIDARLGVLTQSKRHAFLASLLGIPHFLVAINKMDLVGYDQEVYERVRAAHEDFAAKLPIHDITYIPVSALQGDNVVEHSAHMPWYEGPTVLGHLEGVHIASDRNLIDFRFPVQMVQRPSQAVRAYAGTLAGGVVRPGDDVLALPSGRQARVERIVTRDGDLDHAFAPQAIALTLDKDIDLSRGDMLVHPANLPRSDREVEATLVWMSETPLRLNTPYLVKQTTRMVRAVVNRLHYRIDPEELHRRPAETLDLNEIGRAELHLYEPILYDAYERNRATGSFVVIDPATNATVGAGMLIERAKHRAPVPRPAERARRTDVTEERSLVAPEDRTHILGHAPATVWLTGLSGSGKSTVARLLEKALIDLGCAAYALDGDNVRQGLNRDLGFSPEDRTENIRRVAEVARLLNQAGLVVVTSFISPYRKDRERAAEVIEQDRFLEVFVDAPLELCQRRDPKGLYRRAQAGEVAFFTGVSAPYEVPCSPSVHLHTDRNTAQECVEQILSALRERGVLSDRATRPGDAERSNRGARG